MCCLSWLSLVGIMSGVRCSQGLLAPYYAKFAVLSLLPPEELRSLSVVVLVRLLLLLLLLLLLILARPFIVWQTAKALLHWSVDEFVDHVEATHSSDRNGILQVRRRQLRPPIEATLIAPDLPHHLQ